MGCDRGEKVGKKQNDEKNTVGVSADKSVIFERKLKRKLENAKKVVFLEERFEM